MGTAGPLNRRGLLQWPAEGMPSLTLEGEARNSLQGRAWVGPLRVYSGLAKRQDRGLINPKEKPWH